MLVAGLAAYLANDLDSIPAFNGGNIFHGNVEKTNEAVLKTVAAFACVMGIAGSHRRGIKFTPPSKNKSYYENLFTMMGIVDPATGAPDSLKLSCFIKNYKLMCQIIINLITYQIDNIHNYEC